MCKFPESGASHILRKHHFALSRMSGIPGPEQGPPRIKGENRIPTIRTDETSVKEVIIAGMTVHRPSRSLLCPAVACYRSNEKVDVRPSQRGGIPV